jgi:hypothetical protein
MPAFESLFRAAYEPSEELLDLSGHFGARAAGQYSRISLFTESACSGVVGAYSPGVEPPDIMPMYC